MTDDINETELFEHEGFVCAVVKHQTKFEKVPWFQGIVYLKNGKDWKRSNWYLKPEDAIKMAKVMARQERRAW